MAQTLKCECANRYEAKINSIKLFDEIRNFFNEQVENGIYVEEQVLKPYYVWKNKKRHIEYYASKWYRCTICGCLWEFEYPDFPAKGFVKKYEDGIYTGTLIIDNNDLHGLTML